jgi:hypothetical protein
MIALRFALVLAASLFASACLPVTTTTPVGSTAGFVNDPALTGIWRGEQQKSESAVYVSFYPQDDGTITLVGMSGPNKSDQGGWAVYSLKTAALGAYHFMDAQEVSSDGKTAGGDSSGKTFPLLYRVNGDGALVIYLADEKAVKAAIASGKIAGTVGEGDMGDVTITASATDLDAFMQTPAGRALFVRPLLILKKVK